MSDYVIKPHFIAILNAEPRSGKTHLIKFIVKDTCVKNDFFDRVFVFTKSPEDYDYIEEDFVYPVYKESTLQFDYLWLKTHKLFSCANVCFSKKSTTSSVSTGDPFFLYMLLIIEGLHLNLI